VPVCWHGIAAGTPVTAAMGDLQCYMLATLRSDKDAGLLSDKCLLYVWVSCLLTFHNYGLIIQGGPKKLSHTLLSISLPNFDLFSKFFHLHISWKICNKLITKYTTIP